MQCQVNVLWMKGWGRELPRYSCFLQENTVICVFRECVCMCMCVTSQYSWNILYILIWNQNTAEIFLCGLFGCSYQNTLKKNSTITKVIKKYFELIRNPPHHQYVLSHSLYFLTFICYQKWFFFSNGLRFPSSQSIYGFCIYH